MMVAYVDFTAYMMRTIAERRSDPADDLVSTLIHSAVDGEASPIRKSSTNPC